MSGSENADKNWAKKRFKKKSKLKMYCQNKQQLY